MAEYIPFITSEEGAKLSKQFYADSDIVRVPLLQARRFISMIGPTSKIWLDPCIDGLDNIETRRSKPKPEKKINRWFDFTKNFAHFEEMGRPDFQKNPDKSIINVFVKAVLNKCAEYKPAWITVPQLPLISNSDRNKINRALAEVTGKWRSDSGYSGQLILPIVFTHKEQLKGKTERKPKIEQAARCYNDSSADGYWVVDSDLTDDEGSVSLRKKRYDNIIDLHEILRDKISSQIKIAGPYWGLNLVLWVRGLVDYPAIGVGSGYQYFLSGRPYGRQASIKLAISSLRRRAEIGSEFKEWIKTVLSTLSPSHPVRAELYDLKTNYSMYEQEDVAKQQIVKFYKHWIDGIAAVPKAGRSMALFQDLSASYVLGKSLPEMRWEGTTRRPESVVEPLMLSCL